jgi:hypothetical protein
MTTTTIGYPTTTKKITPDALRKLPVHRYAALFRPVEDDERERLRDALEAGYDQSHPIIVWKQTGEIVDGRNRRDLAVELRLRDVPVAVVSFPDEDEVRRFIVQQNLARRHLNSSERAELAAQLVVNGGVSVRQAAKTTGVSKTSTQRAAAKARDAAVPSGTPARTRTTGADGKSYPATKSEQARASSTKPTGTSTAPKETTKRTSGKPKFSDLIRPLHKYARDWDEGSFKGMTPAEARRLVPLVAETMEELPRLLRLLGALADRSTVMRALR